MIGWFLCRHSKPDQAEVKNQKKTQKPGLFEQSDTQVSSPTLEMEVGEVT